MGGEEFFYLFFFSRGDTDRTRGRRRGRVGDTQNAVRVRGRRFDEEIPRACLLAPLIIAPGALFSAEHLEDVARDHPGFSVRPDKGDKVGQQTCQTQPPVQKPALFFLFCFGVGGWGVNGSVLLPFEGEKKEQGSLSRFNISRNNNIRSHFYVIVFSL